MSTSSEIINNLRHQLNLYKQTLNELEAENSLQSVTSPSPPTPVTRPKKGYIKVKEILEIFKINKQEYNDILAAVRFSMIYNKVDFKIPYKDQDVTLISKIIEKVITVFCNN